MKKYIDLHAHPFLEYFEDREILINKAFDLGVSHIFVVGTDLNNSKEAIEISSKFNYVYPIIGIHPNDSWNKKIITKLEKLVTPEVVGIGEVGLDYHYKNTPSKKIQKKLFIKQIKIAKKNEIPIIVHSRDSHEDTYKIIRKYKKKYPKLNFILHSYSSGPDYVQKYVELGVYFSFSGVVTFKNAKSTQDAAKLVPLNLLFCETDMPYLAPVPHRGKTNMIEYVIETTNFIAQLKNVKIEELLDNINKNMERVFTRIKYE